MSDDEECQGCVWVPISGPEKVIADAIGAREQLETWNPNCPLHGDHTDFGRSIREDLADPDTATELIIDEPTEACIARVMRETPHFTRTKALDYIAAAHRGNVICLDCGSENHTRGSDWCRYGLDP